MSTKKNNWLLKRASERSTWIGLTAFAASLGMTISGEISEVIISLGVGISGLIVALTNDK